MTQLQPTIDYNSVPEVRDLPNSWLLPGDISREQENQVVHYLLDNNLKNPDQKKLQELLNAERIHARVHTLSSGIRYITLRKEDGEEIFDAHAYKGLAAPLIPSGDPENTMPSDASPLSIKYFVSPNNEINLGDGFNLWSITTSKQDQSIQSYIQKSFSVSGKTIKLDYQIQPESTPKGSYLNLRCEVQSKIERSITKYEQLQIRTDIDQVKNKNNPFCTTTLTVSYNLSDRQSQTEHDQLTFKFRTDGQLDQILGISESNLPNPAWSNPALKAIKKASKEWITYNAQTPEAKILSEAVFGQDVTQCIHDSRRTLAAIIQAAIKEQDINVAKTLNFERMEE